MKNSHQAVIDLLRLCRFPTRSFAIDTTQLDTLGISMPGDRKCVLLEWWNMCFLQRCRRASMQVSCHFFFFDDLLKTKTESSQGPASWIKKRKWTNSNAELFREYNFQWKSLIAISVLLFRFPYSDVRMGSWVIAVKQKTQQIYIRVRTAKKNNNNVAIINFTEVTIAKKGSRL